MDLSNLDLHRQKHNFVAVNYNASALEAIFSCSVHRLFFVELSTNVLIRKEGYKFVVCTYSCDKFVISGMVQ
jgi:hypothetical protein